MMHVNYPTLVCLYCFEPIHSPPLASEYIAPTTRKVVGLVDYDVTYMLLWVHNWDIIGV